MFVVLYASIGRLQSLRRVLAEKVGLDTSELAVVMALYAMQHLPDVRIRDIADQMYSAHGNVTVTLTKLQESGWVLKSTSESDNRAVSVRLTARARAVMEALQQELDEVNDVWFEDVDVEDVGVVIRVLDALVRQYPRARQLSSAMKLDA
jgi:DNA-binding MarR family transcriptional regulator